MTLNQFVSMDGIGPSSEAYESSVLPLNYTDNVSNITENTTKRNAGPGLGHELLSVLS